MRVEVRSPWPQRTTVAVGGLLLASGLLGLVVSTRLMLPVTDTVVVPLDGTVVALLAAGTRSAGLVVAATGLHGEVGLAGTSRAGRAALIAWGLRDLVLLLLVTLRPRDGGIAAALVVTGSVLRIAFVVAALVSAVAVVRARVLAGWARWALVPLAIVEVLLAALADSPSIGAGFALALAAALAAWPVALVEPVLTILAAVALLTWGRVEALKHRARLIHDAW